MEGGGGKNALVCPPPLKKICFDVPARKARPLTGLGQTGDAQPRFVNGHGIAEFDDGDVVVERAQPKLWVSVDVSYVVHGPAAGINLPVVFANGYGQVLGTETVGTNEV